MMSDILTRASGDIFPTPSVFVYAGVDDGAGAGERGPAPPQLAFIPGGSGGTGRRCRMIRRTTASPTLFRSVLGETSSGTQGR